MKELCVVGNQVKELMVPLEEYAILSEEATLLDAVHALAEAQTKLPPDRQPHRAVLVTLLLGTHSYFEYFPLNRDRSKAGGFPFFPLVGTTCIVFPSRRRTRHNREANKNV